MQIKLYTDSVRILIWLKFESSKRVSFINITISDWFRDNDSSTCTECHEEASIKPQRKRGQRQHAEALES